MGPIVVNGIQRIENKFFFHFPNGGSRRWGSLGGKLGETGFQYQVFRQERFAAADQDPALDRVFEFADIPRPGLIYKQIHGLV